jgi:MFS family permease
MYGPHTIITLAALVAVAAVAGGAIAGIGEAIAARRQHQLMRGDDAFSSIWNGSVIAISSICMALVINSALEDIGWYWPFALLILCPISALAISILASIDSKATNKLKLKMAQRKSPLRVALTYLAFGLAIGIAAQLAVVSFAHLG